MKRNLFKLNNSFYDLLIIGGGITGACAAWDASLRGLSVALVDKGDFGAATSSASGKVIHGGIRYMQYGAFHRVRESLHERMVLSRIAPQFAHPLPFIVPTYGHLLKGKEVLRIGMVLYDLLGLDKNKSLDPAKRIPGHRMLSRNKVLEFVPGLIEKDLTGGVLYYDCQMHNSERLTLSFLLAASKAGADLANYLKVTSFTLQSDRVTGVKVEDALSGDKFDIKAKVVLNASGPWTRFLLMSLKNFRFQLKGQFSKGVHIITRCLIKKYAVAMASNQKHADALVQRGGRHFFIMPWRNHSLIGTTNVPFDGSPDEKMVTERDVLDLLQDVNIAYPGANIKREDVVYCYGGLYPDDIKKKYESGYQGDRKDQIINHSAVDGVEGLITVINVKYTTGRKLAQRTIDLVFRKMGYKAPKCLTENRYIHGGEIDRFDEYLSIEMEKNSSRLDKRIIKHLIYNYGTSYTQIMNYIDYNHKWGEAISKNLPIIKAQILHAIRYEMALKLTDVVFRRTGLGTLGNPGEQSLEICSKIMAEELGWDDTRLNNEIAEVRDVFSLN